VVEDTLYFLRQKCSANNLVFNDISLTVIFAEVTENECSIRESGPLFQRSTILNICYHNRNPLTLTRIVDLRNSGWVLYVIRI